MVQWATGNIGRKALRGIIEHPAMTLAGVHVYDPDKVGHDAGELCGVDAVGVLATGRIEDVLAVGADCVLYMPRVFDLDDVCRTAGIRRERGDDLRPVPPSAEHRPSDEDPRRGRLRGRRYVNPQHGK